MCPIADEPPGMFVQIPVQTAHKVPGIDAIFVGPYDLSGSMGLLGQVGHPDVTAAVSVVRAACLQAGLAFGIYCGTAEQAKVEIESGARLVAIGTDILHLANSARSVLDALRPPLKL